MSTIAFARRRHSRAAKGLLLGIATLLLLALVGCATTEANNIDKKQDFPNTITVGPVSMGYPDEFSVFGENRNGPILPEGMDLMTSTLMNKDMTVSFTVSQVTDPNGGGLDAIQAKYEEARNRNPDDMDEMQRMMLEATKNAVRLDPERFKLNGHDALVYGIDLNNSMMREYYVEIDGQVVAAVQLALPKAVYDADPEYYDGIIASLVVNTDGDMSFNKPSGNKALTPEQKSAASKAAIDYCQNKYGIEVKLANDEYIVDGFPVQGVGFAEDENGTAVFVEYGIEQFAVDVPDGIAKRDSRQASQIHEALVKYMWQETGLPEPMDQYIIEKPFMWATFYDGNNIAEVCAEAGTIDVMLLYAQDPGEPTAMPQGFSRILALTMKDKAEWATMANPSSLWYLAPEATLPYLKSSLFITPGTDGKPELKKQEFNDQTVCYYGSDLMNELFDTTMSEGAASESLVGRSFTCKADAPTFADTEVVPLFFSSAQWGELTSGYTNVGYTIENIGPKGMKTYGSKGVQTDLDGARTMGVWTFGDYHVVYASPGSTVTFFETTPSEVFSRASSGK